jgi:hypothetical protein
MGQCNTTIVLENPDGTSQSSTGLSPDDAVEALRGLDGRRGVTMTITQDGVDEHLMVAVDGSRAFLGLERPDGLLQFVVRNHDQAGTTWPFMIGGQESEIEDRYLPELRVAALVVEEWLKEGESSTQGHWELQ